MINLVVNRLFPHIC